MCVRVQVKIIIDLGAFFQVLEYYFHCKNVQKSESYS